MEVFGFISLACDPVVNLVLDDGARPRCVEVSTESVKRLLRVFMPSVVSHREHCL
jgi:hypothetical protein